MGNFILLPFGAHFPLTQKYLLSTFHMDNDNKSNKIVRYVVYYKVRKLQRPWKKKCNRVGRAGGQWWVCGFKWGE